MVQIDDIFDAGQLARIELISEHGFEVTMQYRNGNLVEASVGSPLTEFEPGDIVWVRPDGRLELAAPELWHELTWIGVVLSVSNEFTVVEGRGRLKKFTTVPGLYEAGNTVECTEDRIVTRLSERPLPGFGRSQDEPADASAFRKPPPEDPVAAGRSWADFGGMPQVVARARELVHIPLERGTALGRIGARAIRGVLFSGPPGTGKTRLAEIVAAESGATFYVIAGPEIFSKYMGDSEDLLRRIFADAHQHRPAIIFFDEIDSVAASRDQDTHEQSKRVVAQLLTLMDSIDSADGIVVIAATNRPDVLDPALRRPGRFDWEIDFVVGGLAEREEILAASGRTVATAGMLPIGRVAAMTDGWSGAELSAIWSEAALCAVVDDREVIVSEDLLAAVARVDEQRRQRATADRVTALGGRRAADRDTPNGAA